MKVSMQLKPKKMATIIGCYLFGVGMTSSAIASDNMVFNLGEITVTAPKAEEVAADANTVTQSDMRLFNRETVGSALNLLPGVTLTNNSRNEQMVSVRGYDARQVPLFIDGIPVYVPYDGYVDLGRFSVSDLSAIQVAKGYSSVSYGPNTLGGAINLVSRKPTKQFEGDVRVGYGQQNTRETSANLGTNQGSWYFQAGAGYRDSDGFRMSNDYKPTKLENGGKRDNSQYKDSKVSLKFGITPNETDEYALSYYKQDGEKGQPPSTEPTARYWKWPQWNKESLYFVSRTALGAQEALKLRMYTDKFDNEINSYTDNTYDHLNVGNPIKTGVSIYHDKTYGGSVELESTRLTNNTFRFVAHYKNDQHEERDGVNLLGANFEDTFRSLSVEDAIQLGSKTVLTLGFAHHELTPDKVYKSDSVYKLPQKQTANNPQAAISYALNQQVSFYASAAQKTRLPTLKDRYSARLGTYIENPSLAAEEAKNYEIGYKGTPWLGASAQVALFQNDIQDKIQSVNLNGAASCSNTNKCQMQNVGEVRIRGLEVSLETPIADKWQIGANYTKMNLENRSDSTKLTGVPETKISAHATWRPIDKIKLVSLVEHNDSRWANNTTQLDGFTVINVKAAWEPLSGLTAEAGVNNLTDKNYSLDYGFPNPGRMWFSNLTYVF